jgi:dihydrofolate synthase / folylpolyglutamate synthase
VLTNVGLEHTRWLGPTLTDIAQEKLAVLPHGATLVTGELEPEAEAVAAAVAAERDARRVRVGAASTAGAAAALPGYQRENFAVAVAAAEALHGPLDPARVVAAAAHAQVPGRLQVVDAAPLTVLDGAHNPSGMRALVRALPDAVGDRPLVAVVSVLDDKDATEMLRALAPRCRALVLTRTANPRTLPAATLASLAGQLGHREAQIVPDPRRALARARELAGADGAVIATGSIYLVADLLSAPGRRRASAL